MGKACTRGEGGGERGEEGEEWQRKPARPAHMRDPKPNPAGRRKRVGGIAAGVRKRMGPHLVEEPSIDSQGSEQRVREGLRAVCDHNHNMGGSGNYMLSRREGVGGEGGEGGVCTAAPT